MGHSDQSLGQIVALKARKVTHIGLDKLDLQPDLYDFQFFSPFNMA